MTPKGRSLVWAHVSIWVDSPGLVRCQEPGRPSISFSADNGQSLLASYPAGKKREEGQEDTPVPYKGMLPLASAHIFLTRVGHMALLAARGIKTSGFSWMVIQSTAMDWMCPLQNVCIEALALSVTV